MRHLSILASMLSNVKSENPIQDTYLQLCTYLLPSCELNHFQYSWYIPKTDIVAFIGMWRPITPLPESISGGPLQITQSPFLRSSVFLLFSHVTSRVLRSNSVFGPHIAVSDGHHRAQNVGFQHIKQQLVLTPISIYKSYYLDDTCMGKIMNNYFLTNICIII